MTPNRIAPAPSGWDLWRRHFSYTEEWHERFRWYRELYWRDAFMVGDQWTPEQIAQMKEKEREA